MNGDKPKVVIIAGPTATGKSAVALPLARELDGEIVSADSIQIYRFMDIGSAKPSPEEQDRVPHHMLDILDPDEEFSAGHYVALARGAIQGVLARGKVPFVVGGTGLYIRGLMGGMAELPPADPAIRHELAEQERVHGPGLLYRRLTEIDPQSAQAIGPRNISRIIRSLEVHALTGRNMSEVQQEHAFSDRPYNSLFICLGSEREILNERIDRRVDSMIHHGLREEVQGLFRRGYAGDLKSMQSLGYRHMGMALAGELDFQSAVRLMKRDTRRYAKRQMTWFRSEPETRWYELDDTIGIESAISHFLGA